MSILRYHSQALYVENVSLKEIAEKYGTPCYIYSRQAIEKNWRQFDDILQDVPHRICYAVKANSNIAILHLLSRLHSNFDIVSLGELERVMAAGGDASQIVFSGVGKSQIEIEKAISLGIFCINVESESELTRLQETALRCGNNTKKIPISLRLNPDIDPKSHAYISTGLKENKFGIEIDQVIKLCKKIAGSRTLELIGIACHIGSQMTDLTPFSLAIDALIALYEKLKSLGIVIQHLNMGGGLGIHYHDENAPSIHDYGQILRKKLAGIPLEIILEPGRAIVGNAGILLTRIEYLKETRHKNFCIVDAGMNDLLRPALYQAYQPIFAAQERQIEKKSYDVVGPVCESADFLGKNRELAVEAGDLLAIDKCGAYGFSMASNYNSRPRPPEILIDGQETHLIRRRETIAELFAAETLVKF